MTDHVQRGDMLQLTCGTVRYVIAWLSRDDAALMVGIAGSRVGRDEGWYRMTYPTKGAVSLNGPYQTAELALNGRLSDNQ